MRHGHIGMPPLGHILHKDLRALGNGFIAEQKGAIGKYGTQKGAFASWSGTKVEDCRC